MYNRFRIINHVKYQQYQLGFLFNTPLFTWNSRIPNPDKMGIKVKFEYRYFKVVCTDSK